VQRVARGVEAWIQHEGLAEMPDGAVHPSPLQRHAPQLQVRLSALTRVLGFQEDLVQPGQSIVALSSHAQNVGAKTASAHLNARRA